MHYSISIQSHFILLPNLLSILLLTNFRITIATTAERAPWHNLVISLLVAQLSFTKIEHFYRHNFPFGEFRGLFDREFPYAYKVLICTTFCSFDPIFRASKSLTNLAIASSCINVTVVDCG